MNAPKWAQDLTINACLHLGMEDIPQLVWRKHKCEWSSGKAWYHDENKCITIYAGSNRLDARLVLLHEIAHMAKPGHDIQMTYKQWHDARSKEKNVVVAPFNPRYRNRIITTKHVSHTPEFWDTAWELFRWAKLPIRYCKEREGEYRKGSIAAYHRSKNKQGTVR